VNLSIRNRSTAYFSTLVAGFLVTFLAVLTFTVTTSLEREFRENLDRNTEILAELFKEELRLNALEEFAEEAEELGLMLRVLDHQGQVFFQSRMWTQRAPRLDAATLPPDGEHHWAEIEWNGTPLVIHSRPVVVDAHPPFTIQVAEGKDSVVAARRELLRWGALLIPLMIALSVLAGLFFSKRALAPLVALRKRADALCADDLTARLPYPPIRDEIYLLTDTLNRALARIEDGYGRLQAFTADAAHELRIPLTAMRGGLEVALRRDRTPEEYREALTDALEEAERLSRITADLLALARADTGERPIHQANVPVREFLHGIVTEMAAAGGRVTCLEAPDGAATFDPDQVQRALLNLIDNGLKHGRAGGTVQASAARVGGELVFRVTDDGPGIPAEHQAKIFDRFYRADKARERARGGSGLGLSIALEIARAHGGGIRFKNAAPSGCEFELFLPLETSNPPLKTV